MTFTQTDPNILLNRAINGETLSREERIELSTYIRSIARNEQRTELLIPSADIEQHKRETIRWRFATIGSNRRDWRWISNARILCA